MVQVEPLTCHTTFIDTFVKPVEQLVKSVVGMKNILSLTEVDHIDGDAHNCRPTNLKILCPNCHSMTPAFRARNSGSKRSRTVVIGEAQVFPKS